MLPSASQSNSRKRGDSSRFQRLEKMMRTFRFLVFKRRQSKHQSSNIKLQKNIKHRMGAPEFFCVAVRLSLTPRFSGVNVLDRGRWNRFSGFSAIGHASSGKNR